MFCPYCGAEQKDDANFCTICGKGLEKNTAKETVTKQNELVAVSTADEAVKRLETKKREEAKSVMILSIIGAALGTFGVPGIIVTLIAKGRLNGWKEKYGELHGMAAASRWITLGGLIYSIYMSVFWTIYFLALFVMFAALIGRAY